MAAVVIVDGGHSAMPYPALPLIPVSHHRWNQYRDRKPSIMFMTDSVLLTRDPELADEVFRLAAVTGCGIEREEPDNPARGWQTARIVLLDPEAARVVVSMGLRRRPSVLVLCREPSEDLWRTAFEIGAERAIELPAEEATLAEIFADAVDISAPQSGRVLAIVGARGGAGASVLAAATALTSARRGDRCLLVDCDPLGGGIDLTVGAESDAGLRWSGLAVSGGRVAVAALHEALPERPVGSGSLTVLSCERDGPSTGLTPEAMRAVLDAARRAGETVVCDLPRSLSEVAVTALRLADRSVVLVPSEVRACAAAGRLLDELREISAGPMSIMVRGPSPGGLAVADVERALGVDAAGVVRWQSGLAAAVERGGLWPSPRGSLARAATDVLGLLDEETAVPAGAR